MLRFLHRTYIAVFRSYPVLARMAAVAMLAEILFASVNNYALSFYVLDDLKQSGRTLGVLASTFLVVEMVLKLPFGHLSDRYGRRLFASAGLTLCILTPAVICFVPLDVFITAPALVFIVLMPLRAIDGTGAAALWPPLFAAVPDNVPQDRRGLAMSVMNTSYLAGLALGPSIAGLAMRFAASAGAPAEWVTKAPFALAAAAAISAAAVARTLPESRGRPARTAARRASEHMPPLGLIAVILLISFGEMFAVGTLAPYMAPYMREVSGIARSDVGFLLLILFIPAGILGIPVGHMVDRWPRHRVVQASMATAALGLWVVPLCGSVVTLLLAGMVVMLGFLFGLPAWLALVADLAPEGKRGRMMGLLSTAQGAGALLGPLLGGYLWDIDIHRPWYAAAAVLTLAAAAALCCLRRGWGGRGGRVGEPETQATE
jgi:DHA1 family multidrug resistance protein-like MFS transporter